MGWSDLPSDLVISIAAHLWEAGDFLRFRAVCRSWKFAVRSFRPSFFPWLAVIQCDRKDDPNKDEFSFFSHVANNHVYKSLVPYSSSIELYYCHIINKDGWMMLELSDGVLVIFNPVTGAQLQHLPSLYNCFDRIGAVFLSDHNLFAFAEVYCTDDDDFHHRILVAATPGDDMWSVIHSSHVFFLYYLENITDIVFHESDQKFYAVNSKGKLLSFCLTRCGGKTVVGQVSTLSKRRRKDAFNRPCLVSYGSNLVLVRMPSPSRKENFEILKYCPDADTWILMTNIGNNSLFIDSNGTAKLLPLPQGDQEGMLRRNCIYFLDFEPIRPSPDPLAREGRLQFVITHVRIYDVSKGIAEPCFSMDIKSDFYLYPSVMWFIPSLSINN